MKNFFKITGMKIADWFGENGEGFSFGVLYTCVIVNIVVIIKRLLTKQK